MGVWPGLLPAHPQSSLLTGAKRKSADMDAIRKKMQSLKSETDGLYNTIAGFEEATREAAARADQADCDIRDYGKKVQQLEIGFDETNDKLTKATESLEEAEKQFKEVESDVSALTRRIMLMEEEDKKAAEQLCQTVTKLAMTSKAADNVMKTIKVVENTSPPSLAVPVTRVSWSAWDRRMPTSVTSPTGTTWRRSGTTPSTTSSVLPPRSSPSSLLRLPSTPRPTGRRCPRSCSRPSTCPPCTSPSRLCSPCTPLAVPPVSSWTPATVPPTVSPSTRVTLSPTPLSVWTWLAVSSPTT